MQLCKLPEEEFISRCLKTEGVSIEQARAFYQKLWRTRIDIRSQSSSTDPAGDSESTGEVVESPKLPFKERIEPGMIVRLAPKQWGFNGTNVLMILSPATAKDYEGGDERTFICAAVTPGLIPTGYELHIANKRTFTVDQFETEVKMEYDLATRYYFIEL